MGFKDWFCKTYYHIEDRAKQFGTLRLRFYVWVLIFAAVFVTGWAVGKWA